MGRLSKARSKIINAISYSSLQCDIKTKQSLISRGMGRSYGDSANSTFVLQTKYFDHFITFDPDNGLLRAEAGITAGYIESHIATRMVCCDPWYKLCNVRWCDSG